MSTPTYYLDIDEGFPAAHQLHGKDSPCARLHGHNWKVRVRLCSTTLDEFGFIADFFDVRAWLREQVIEPLDHQFLNELPQFKDVPTTSEHIVRWIFDTLNAQIDDKFPGLKLISVRLWETEDFATTISISPEGVL